MSWGAFLIIAMAVSVLMCGQLGLTWLTVTPAHRRVIEHVIASCATVMLLTYFVAAADCLQTKQCAPPHLRSADKPPMADQRALGSSGDAEPRLATR